MPETPWRTERHDDHRGGWILKDETDTLAIGMTKADAELAARAVNSHDALERSLRELRLFVSDLPIVQKNPRFAGINQRALQALAAAQPQQPAAPEPPPAAWDPRDPPKPPADRDLREVSNIGGEP